MYIILIIFIIYLFLIRCDNSKSFNKFDKYLYTHRGLFNNLDVAENSLTAFKNGCSKGYGTELDVHLTKDKRLVVIHDSKIDRVTGVEGIVEEMTYGELSKCHLFYTADTIPLFEDVVKIYEGKCPIIIELKTYKSNYEELVKETLKLTDSHPSLTCCYESFDPYPIIWLRKNRPEVIRGQLSYNYLKDKKSKLNIVEKFTLQYLLMNHLSRPNFIAYDVKTKFNLSKYLTLKLFKTKQVAWTVKTQEMLNKKEKEGLIIFEGFIPKND